MKINKLFLMISVFLILNVALVSAEWDEIHDGWHEYNDDFTIDGVLYQITLNQNSQDKLIIKVDDENRVVELEECQIMNDYKYCFEEANMSRPEATITSSGVAVPGVRLKIYENTIKENDLTITHDFEVLAKDLKEIPIKLVVENQGSDWIKNVKYRLTIPDNMKIVNQYNFKWDGSRTLTLEFALSPKETRRFSLKVLPETYDIHQFNYSIEYNAISEDKLIESSFNLDLSAPFKVTDTLSSTNVGLDENLYYTISVENINPNEDLRIKKFNIKGPFNFEYVPVKGLSLNKVAEFKNRANTIRGEDTEEYKLLIIPKSDGDKNITFEYEFEIEGETFKQTIVKPFKVEEKGLKAELQLNKDAVIPGEALELTLVLENTNKNLRYRDISFEIESDLFDQAMDLDSLDSNLEKRFQVQQFTSPIIEKDETYVFTGILKYKGASDYEFTKEIEKKLEVTGSGELIKLTQTVNPKTAVKPGTEILVTVNLENLKDQSFDKVNVFEQYPRQIELISGDTSKTISLSNNENKNAYIYKLKIPKLYKQDEFNITSTAILSEIGYNKAITTTVTVDVPEDIFAEKEQEVVPDDTKEAIPEVIVNKKTKDNEDNGFFGNLISSIEDFFVGIFGG